MGPSSARCGSPAGDERGDGAAAMVTASPARSTGAVPGLPVVLETHSNLELDRRDGERWTRIAEDDDGGEDTEARIATTLPPGRDRIAVRPDGALTGPSLLDVNVAE